MKFEDRWYQKESVEALMNDVFISISLGNTIHPVAVIPTGAGKSVILCKLIDKYLTECPQKDVLIISHVSEILEQNHERISSYLGDDFLGLYSASLDIKEKKKITVAGIQSIYKKPELFTNVGLVIIDECHLINSKDEGMYRTFLDKLDAVYLGLTATPFRTGQGYIYKDYSHVKEKKIKTLFNKLSYDLSSYENYNRLIDEGYLVELIPAPTDFEMDVSDIHKVAGEFVADELSLKFDREEITNRICENIIKYAKEKYKKWLIFAIDIQHAKNIKEILISKGISCEDVHSTMEKEKAHILSDFRAGKIRALVNVNMLTTGLDIPEIDLIAHLRPTASPIYHVQTNGRGSRPAPNKTHCLVLDFAGNTKRHGPINDVFVIEPDNKKKKKNNLPLAKECENCESLNSLRAKECIACGEEFLIKHGLNQDIEQTNLIKKQILEKWCDVQNISYSVHSKPGSPSSMRVMYNCGFNSYSEWVMINHSGYPKAKAIKWVRNRWKGEGDPPENLADLMANKKFLKKPIRILVNLSGKYAEIKDFDFSHYQKEFPVEIPIFDFDKKENVTASEYFDDDIPF